MRFLAPGQRSGPRPLARAVKSGGLRGLASALLRRLGPDTAQYRHTLVDVVGDRAHSAGYLSAQLDGEDLDGQLNRANALGAIVVGTRGDWEGAPRKDDLLLFGRSGTLLR